MKKLSIIRRFDMFEVEIEDLSWSSQFKLKVIKIEREALLLLPNPNNKAVLKQYQKWENITMKAELSIHWIFDISYFAKIKVQDVPRPK